MQPLTAFWKAHRLGVCYGLLWSFVALAIDSLAGFEFLWGSSQHPSALVSWLVPLAGLNTWHLYRRLRSVQVAPQPAGLA